MPRYDYRCPDCGTTEEWTFSLDELGRLCEVVCACGAVMRRVFSAVPAIFKGSGFYSTGG